MNNSGDATAPDQKIPEICVVIPCYNASQFIARTVQSVQVQQGVSVRLIVVDDGSEDGTIEHLAAFGNTIEVHERPHLGACAARNYGLSLVNTHYVMFLDADDYLEIGTLAGLVDILKMTGAGSAFAPVFDADAMGHSGPRYQPRTDSMSHFVSDWVRGRFIPPCGILWKTADVLEAGGWDEKIKKNQDGDLVLRAAVNGTTFCKSQQGAGVYWSHDHPDRISNTFSAQKILDSFRILTRTHEKLNDIGQATSETHHAFSWATHQLQRIAFRYNLNSVAAEISHYRRTAGWPAAEGSRSHVWLSKLLGLGAKERFAQYLRRIRNQIN